jgi:hypothetical protein
MRQSLPARQAGVRSGVLGVLACKESGGLTVAQTLLVAIRIAR